MPLLLLLALPLVASVRSGTQADTWWGSGLSDDDFDSFIDTWPTVNVYLATDSAKTQARFLTRLDSTRLDST